MRLLLLALLLPANAFTREYVRVSPRDPGYLELSSGRPYIPIGLNLIAPPRAAETRRNHSLMPGNGLAQVHRYLDPGAQPEICKGPVGILAAVPAFPPALTPE